MDTREIVAVEMSRKEARAKAAALRDGGARARVQESTVLVRGARPRAVWLVIVRY